MWRKRTEPPPEPDEVRSARAELERAERQLQEARANAPRVNQIGETLRELLRRNGFGESIETAFRKRRTS